MLCLRPDDGIAKGMAATQPMARMQHTHTHQLDSSTVSYQDPLRPSPALPGETSVLSPARKQQALACWRNRGRLAEESART